VLPSGAHAMLISIPRPRPSSANWIATFRRSGSASHGGAGNRPSLTFSASRGGAKKF
jgi:hypothetical protein